MPDVVAITRAPRLARERSYRERDEPSELAPPEVWIQDVAALFGLLAFDVRQRIAGALPWILARTLRSDEAERRVLALRERGFGAVRLDPATLRFDPPGEQGARAFLRAGLLDLEPWGARVPLESVSLATLSTLDLARGHQSIEMRDVRVRGVRMYTRPFVSHEHARERARVLHLFLRASAPLRLVEGRVALPEESGPTARGRFDALVAKVRDGLPPETPFLDELVASPRKRTSLAITGEEADRTSLENNERETDLAVSLLARAVLEGQR